MQQRSHIISVEALKLELEGVHSDQTSNQLLHNTYTTGPPLPGGHLPCNQRPLGQPSTALWTYLSDIEAVGGHRAALTNIARQWRSSDTRRGPKFRKPIAFVGFAVLTSLPLRIRGTLLIRKAIEHVPRSKTGRLRRELSFPDRFWFPAGLKFVIRTSVCNIFFFCWPIVLHTAVTKVDMFTEVKSHMDVL